MKKILFPALLLGLLWAGPVFADDINSIFERVNDFIAKQNYSKALEELSWARKEIEKMHLAKVQSFIPNTLAGFTGGKIESNSALGMSNIERTYTKGSQQIKLSLAGGSGASSDAFGGIAALGRMAAMMQGSVPGQETFRILGRTANLQSFTDQNRADLTIFLNSGSTLRLELDGSTSGQILRTAAEQLKINELDTYLSGAM